MVVGGGGSLEMMKSPQHDDVVLDHWPMFRLRGLQRKLRSSRFVSLLMYQRVIQEEADQRGD